MAALVGRARQAPRVIRGALGSENDVGTGLACGGDGQRGQFAGLGDGWDAGPMLGSQLAMNEFACECGYAATSP